MVGTPGAVLATIIIFGLDLLAQNRQAR